jgi:exonuclease SbcC
MFEAKSLEVEKAKALVLGEDRLKTSEFVKQGNNQKQTLQIEKDNLLVNIDREKQFRKNLDDFKQLLQVSKEAGKNWQLMNKLIGDATGSKFSSYAQKLTLKQLTIAANQRLEQLDKRYHLVASDTQNQELQVIDRDMGNSIRTVNTLSGGETFLMSLALALGLSDLASHKVQLGSLFIDEGFGTLDPEVLEKTITMLEKLQMQDNKTIGIISHVEALKERIRVKVNVVKNGQGYSEVRV